MGLAALPVPDLAVLLPAPVVPPGIVDIMVRESSQMMYRHGYSRDVHSHHPKIHWSHWPHLLDVLLIHSLIQH
jgi:hypothetical protein